MYVKKLTLNEQGFPEVLSNIPAPPKQLYVVGRPLSELMGQPRVAIVGSRSISPYGKQVTIRLARELAQQGIVIVSGLALGVDSTAQQAALEAGGTVIAVLPSPLDAIVPVANRRLAQQIIDNGGTLVSEYESGLHPVKQYFIARNRIVSGLADAVLIPEAAEKSGSLHTSRFALEQGRDVMVVPGNINSQNSVGTNNLLKTGAAPVTCSEDVLHILGMEARASDKRHVKGRNDNEQSIIDLLMKGVSDGGELLDQSGLSASQFGQCLTMLELGGKIRSLGANNWSIF